MATVGTRVATVTVNAAFLQEIKEVNEELWRLLGDLRKICGCAVSVRDHADRVLKMLLELRDQLALHFALEEAFGYFEDPLLVMPAVAEQAATLRAEHRQLYLLVNQLSDHAEQLWSEGNLAEYTVHVPRLFWIFDQQLQRHESFENELIMRQFDDIGVGD